MDLNPDRWLPQAKAGDVPAFNRLVDYHQSLAYHIAYHRLDNADDALDTCQEEMVSAWRALLEQALGQLAEDHRTVILLDHAGFDYAETAVILGVEVGTVKSRPSRARSQPRAQVAGSPLTGQGSRAIIRSTDHDH